MFLIFSIEIILYMFALISIRFAVEITSLILYCKDNLYFTENQIKTTKKISFEIKLHLFTQTFILMCL